MFESVQDCIRKNRILQTFQLFNSRNLNKPILQQCPFVMPSVQTDSPTPALIHRSLDYQRTADGQLTSKTISGNNGKIGIQHPPFGLNQAMKIA